MDECFFVSIDLELTNLCGNSCAICPREKISRPKGLMSKKTLGFIVELIAKEGRLITLSGMGNPLQHPDVFDVIRSIRANGADAGIVVNPASLTTEKIERLIEAAPNVIAISFPSFRDAVFEKIVPDISFDKAMKITRELIAGAKGKVGVKIAGVQAKINSDEKDDFVRFWKGLGVFANMFDCHGRGGNLEPSEIYTTETNKVFSGTCGMFGFHTFITWEGDVIACCHDLNGKTMMGNIVNDGLEAIVEAKNRILKSGNMFNLCQTCDEPLRLCDLPTGSQPNSRRSRRKFFRSLQKTN